MEKRATDPKDAVRPVGRPKGTSSKGEQTKAAILAAAMRLFAKQGIEKTTMRQIATTAGVSPGLAYRYYSAKEQITCRGTRKMLPSSWPSYPISPSATSQRVSSR